MSKLSSLVTTAISGKPQQAAGERSVVSRDLRQTLPIAMASPVSATIRQLYSIFLWDFSGSMSAKGANGAQIVEFTEGVGADPAGKRSLAEFNFSVPPKVIEVSEPYATHIQPTQGGGKFIESQGSILKEIRVQGTTGVRPNTGLTDLFGIGGSGEILGQVAGVNSLLGNFPAVNQGISLLQGADRLATGFGGLSANEITGHDDIIFLRNIFRLYSDLKASGDGAQLGMVWSNQKDGEYWLVEPKDFRVSQSSQSPLSYNYQMTLTTLSKFEPRSSGGIFDIVSEIRSAKMWLQRTYNYGTELVNTYLLLKTNLDKLEGLPIAFETLVIGPMERVANALVASSISSPRSKQELRNQTLVLSEALQEALDAARAAQTRATFRREQWAVRQNIYERSLRKALQVTNSILAEQLISKTVADTVIDRQIKYLDAYNKGGVGTAQRRPPQTGGDPTFLGNQQISAGTAQSVVHPGETIFDVASRLLKDDRLWKSLVVLNQLKPPYVSNTPADGVLGPGEAILYPVPVSQGMSSNVITALQTSDEEITKTNADPLEIAYGRDLRLQSESSTGQDRTDLVVNQRGDLGSTQGVENVTQAMRLKFVTERGQLPAHPNYGARYALGSKATSSSFNQFRIDTRSTILTDPRVRLINKLNFVVSGDLLGVEADVTLVDSNTILQTSFAVRRF